MIFTQIQTAADTAGKLAEGLSGGPADQSIKLIDLILAGGYFMIPLGILLLLSFYFIFDRYQYIRRAKGNPEELFGRVKRALEKQDIQSARAICEQDQTPVGKMLLQGLNHAGSPLKVIQTAIENTGRIEAYYLETNLSYLGMIAGAGPMIGFLGTVTGMIQAFIAISQQEGSISPKLLSEGIYEAMITTAAGLIVGIIAYIAYNYFVRMVSDVVHHMEATTIEFIDLLQRPQ